MRALADKALFQRLAEQQGLAVPRAEIVSDSSDLNRLARLRPQTYEQLGARF